SLAKQGNGKLIIDNSGINDFSGGVNIAGGAIQIGNNDASGNLPAAGNILNNGALVYARVDTVTISNVIAGTGTLTNNGSGTLVLAGANTFSGATVVSQGTLQIANNSALGTTNGPTIIASGATLDINGSAGNTRRLGGEPIVISGSGASGAGALINNGADTFPAMSSVTLAGTATIGGAGRLDIRPLTGTDPATSQLLTSGNAYNLVKASGNFFGISDSTIDPMLGDIDIQGGTFNFQGNNTSLGNPANTLTVESGATFELYAATNLVNKNIVVADSAYILNGSGANTIIGPITLQDVGFINVGGTSLTLNGSLNGGGIMSLNGLGQLIVNGNGSAFTGSENLNFGTLTVNGILGGNITGLPGTTFSGSGTNLGSADLYGNVYPGGANAAGTLTLGSLTLESGAAPAFDLSGTNSDNGGFNDAIQVNGDLIANGNTINVNFLQGQPQDGVYHLFNYTGSLVNGTNSSFSPTVGVAGGASRFGLVLDYNTPNQINLDVTGGPASVVWNTTGSPSWDTFSSQNWSNLTTHVSPDYFYSGDSAWFTDLPGVVTNVTINGVVSPSVLTNDASTNNFNFSGSGKITGSSSIVKTGASTMTLGTVNDFTGNVLVSGGSLQMNANGALGATNGSVTITNGGTLDIGGPSFAVNTVTTGLKQFYVSGWGVNSNGAIINSSVNYQYAANDLMTITLQGDTALGGPGIATPGNGNVAGRWDMRAGSLGNPVLSTSGQAYNLYKVGSNQVVLMNVTVDAALANIDVRQGFLEVQGPTTLGNTASNLTVEAGATFGMYASTTNLNKNFILNGDGQTYSIFSEGGGNVIAGPVTLNGSCILGATTVLTNLNTISGSGSLVKFGASILYLFGTNTYTGSTLVSTGTVALVNTGSILASTNLTVSAGATLSASGRTDGQLALASGQNLNGFGTVAGNLAANIGSTVAPGSTATIGTLTVNGSATLGGMTTVKIDKTGNTRDLLTAAGAMNYGGTLNVVALTGAFALNDSFKVFNGTSYSGSFTINPATPGSGLIWDTSSLNLNGTLKVASAVNTTPTNIVVVVSGGNLNLSWPPDHTGWRLQVQTNSLTTGLGTNWVDVPGSAATNAISIPVNPTNGAVFYRMAY
ncbi:MAG TPA: autotransporter-associated beta strand repeat-containing protein, partial [Verrucomicrobiae bacterium]